jgi:hypothetical protein
MKLLNCVQALAFHMNLILLPLDTTLAMTDIYLTDKEIRPRNPVGQQGISCPTVALAQEKTWGSLSANLVKHHPEVEHNLRKIQRIIKEGGYTAGQLSQICNLFGIARIGNKA